MSIFIILAASVRFFPIDFFYARSLDDDAAKIAFALRGAHDRAVNQEQASAWGVRFTNNASGGDFYQVYKGDSFPSGTVVERVSLNETVQMTSPVSGATADVQFAKMTGLPTGAGSIIISLIAKPSVSKTITVLSNGQVQY